MKLVKESINFERGKEPLPSMGIGDVKVREQILKEIGDKGIRINIYYSSEVPENVLKNIYELKKLVDEVLDLGVDPKDIELSTADSICVTGFTVRDGNNVLLHCLTEEDANIIAETIKIFMIGGEQINIGRTSMEPYIRTYKENKWMKDLKVNRIKFGKTLK
jgi:hypothetical protein